MDMPLEEKILHEIGFGDLKVENSPGCKFYRQRAIKDLEEAIGNKSHRQIAPPNAELIKVLKRIAENGDERDSLLNTWHAATKAIAAHIENAHLKPAEQKQKLEEVAHHLDAIYPPIGKSNSVVAGR